MRVPEGWKSLCLKDVIEGNIKNGYSPLAADAETGYWVLGLGAIGDDRINISEVKPVVPEKKVLQNLLNPDDFLVSRSNTPDKVGKSFRFQGELENCSYPDLMMRFRINKRIADVSYIEQLLKSSMVRIYLSNCAAGSSSTMVKITKGVLEKTPIQLPIMLEQKQIAQTLFTWDKAIATCEQLLANSQQQKKALMQQLLTGKKRLLDEDGVRFSNMWEHNIIGKLIKEVKGEKEENPNVIELLTVKLHYKGAVRSGKYPNATERGRPYFKRFENELIIGRQNLHNGGVAIVPKNCDGLIASNAISSFENRKNVNIHFILSIMSTAHFRFLVDNLTGGTGQKEVSVGELLKMHILAPNYEEQNKIATVLSTADREIERLQIKLEALKQEKKALMQQLLTGKRRVTLTSME